MKEQGANLVANLSAPDSAKIKDKEAFLEIFEEIAMPLEASSQNNLNLCRMGGFKALLEVFMCSQDDEIRKKASAMMSSLMSNNLKVQEFAMKHGAVNLSCQLERESKP